MSAIGGAPSTSGPPRRSCAVAGPGSIRTPPAPVLPQFLVLALVWGSSFLLIKNGLEGLSWAQVALGRLVLGALALLGICAATRRRLPPWGPVWLHLAAVAVLLCVAPFLLFSWAELRLSSSLASIYNATTPLMTTLVALVALPSRERPGRSALAGLGLGFAGVCVVLAPWRGVGGGQATAQGALLLATLCYGGAFIWLRRFVAPFGLPAVPVATVQVLLGALEMLVLAPLLDRRAVHLTPVVVLSMLGLGVLGTGVAYVWNQNVLTGWGPTNASTVTYLTPVVGVVLGLVVKGEQVSWNEPAGALVIVLGIAAAQGRLRLRWR